MHDLPSDILEHVRAWNKTDLSKIVKHIQSLEESEQEALKELIKYNHSQVHAGQDLKEYKKLETLFEDAGVDKGNIGSSQFLKLLDETLSS